MKPIKPLIIKMLFGDMRFIKAFTVILLVGIGGVILYFIGVAALETRFPRISILDPSTYLTSDSLIIFNGGFLAVVLIYLEYLLIKWITRKKRAVMPLPDEADAKKPGSSIGNKLLKYFLFFLSIFFSLVPVILYFILFEVLLFEDAGTLDYVVFSVSVILMPLIGGITAIIAAVMVGGSLSKVALVFALFMIGNALITLGFLISPYIEVQYTWLSPNNSPVISVLPA